MNFFEKHALFSYMTFLTKLKLLVISLFETNNEELIKTNRKTRHSSEGFPETHKSNFLDFFSGIFQPNSKTRNVIGRFSVTAMSVTAISSILLWQFSGVVHAQQREIINQNFIELKNSSGTLLGPFNSQYPNMVCTPGDVATTPLTGTGNCLRYVNDSRCEAPVGSPADTDICVVGWETRAPEVFASIVSAGYIAHPIQLGISNGGLLENVSVPNGSTELNADAPNRIYQNICLAANETIPFSFDLADPGSTGTEDSQARIGIWPLNSEFPAASLDSFTSTAVNTPTFQTFTGSLTAPATSGIYQIGFESVSPAGTRGNYLQAVSVTLPPLVDIGGAGSLTGNQTYNEPGGTTQVSMLSLRLNGIVGAGVTIPINLVAGSTATPDADFILGNPTGPVGTPSLTHLNGTSTWVINVPAGSYSGGISQANIEVPISILSDAIAETPETLSFSVGTPSGATVSDPICASDFTPTSGTITIQNPSQSIAKVLDSNADEDGNAEVSVGDTLSYSITATNDGTTTLSNVVVSDPLITPNSTTCASVAPAATCVLTGTYVVQASDVTAGQIVNTGTADSDQTAAVTDSETTAIVTPPPADLLISKTASKKVATAGDLISYTILIRNNSNYIARDVTITDNLPNGFKIDKTSIRVKTYAANHTLVTDTPAISSGLDPVNISALTIPIAAEGYLKISYIVRIGSNIIAVSNINTAEATANANSNTATATVSINQNTVLNQSSLIGKVFHDRDADGYQDDANATGISLKSDYFGWNSLHLGGLNGRVSVLDDPNKYRKVIRMPYSKKNDFKVTTQQGSVITVDNRGQISESHIGKKAKGLTAQDIRVTTRRIRGIPTQTPVKAMRIAANETDVLEITIINYGIHEEGIPGVRLATVEGLLIETDGHGRYHIPDVDGGRRGWGKNFILKVDPASLPEGARFTTENPRVLRITGQALNKINFGVRLPIQKAPERKVDKPAQYKNQIRKRIVSRKVPVYKTVKVELASIFFDKDKYSIRADQRGNLELLMDRIQQYGKGHIVIDAYTDARHTANYNIQLANKRANTIRHQLNKRLGASLMRQVKIEVDKSAYQEVPHNDPNAIDYNATNNTDMVSCSVNIVSEATETRYADKPVFTLKIITHGESDNRSDNMNEVNRQDNRRADVSINQQVLTGTRTVSEEISEQVRVKVSEASTRSIRLQDGGVIWLSNDPASLTPVLNVSTAKHIQMDGKRFATPLSFNITTNYAAFIDQWELSVYDSADQDEASPLVTFMGRNLVSKRLVKWNGKTRDGRSIAIGDKLKYILKVRDKAGHMDSTQARYLTLEGPDRFIKQQQPNNDSGFENTLAHQSIPLHGSRVRIFGRDVAVGNSIRINQENIRLEKSRFVIEKLLPEGHHEFDVAITDDNQNSYHQSLSVDVKGKYLFMVGLADVTVGEAKVTGNLETLSDGDRHLDGDIFVDGRLAFYLKGKIKGKYLVTAQLDTGSQEIDKLFDDIHKKDPRSLFRRLDPDKYYPVYGDDSTIIDDSNSQGKLYLRVDWDKSRALWGNYNTDINGTELSSFNRGLYGAKLNHRSAKVTADGEHQSDVTLFGSEAQSAFRHNQFLGTGGSLYYLKDTDIVNGSEKLWIEVRQRNGERALQRITLEEGRDYQIDDFQGRIILHRPLLQIARQSTPSLIKDTPLDGDQVYLMVDYEYVPNNFDSDKASYGGRAKLWVNDHVALGGTYVHENRQDNDYDLKGVDITLQKARGSYLKAEYAETKSLQTAGSFLSEDGGLNFATITNQDTSSDLKGSAYSLEARANLQQFSDKNGAIGAWYKFRDKGFSNARLRDNTETIETGIEAQIEATDDLKLSLRSTLLDKKQGLKTTTASVQGDYKVNHKLTLSAEVRHIKENHAADQTQDGEGTLGAFKVGYDLNKDLNLYAIAQGTLDKKGAYDENNLFTLGSHAKINNKLELNAEISSGDRGDGVLVGVNYTVNNGYHLYSNYTLSTDRTDFAGNRVNNKRNVFTVGQRKTLSNQLKVYTEHQFTHESEQSGLSHTFGLDYQLNKALTTTASVQTARLDKANGGLIDRDAFTVGLHYKHNHTDASSRLEYRRDVGSTEKTEQWVTTNRIHYQLNPSMRLQGKLNYSETRDKIGSTLDARFSEAGVGFAYRPVQHDRLNLLGRLTYLYDLQPESQSTLPDERSLIGSFEGSYQLNQKWQVGGKLAHKLSEIRTGRRTGQWIKNDATLVAGRVRYHLTHNWDATAEYHWMNSDASQDSQHGAMLSVDRHIGKNIKLGIGYNFTDFDDDLTNTDGNAKGWFVNFVGKF